MTNEEASIIVGNIPIILDDCYSIEEYQQAKAMAIEALQHESEYQTLKINEEAMTEIASDFQRRVHEYQENVQKCIERIDNLGEYENPTELISRKRAILIASNEAIKIIKEVFEVEE